MAWQDLTGDIARLAAVSALALPVLGYYRHLNGKSAQDGRRYLGAIAGLAIWTILGVFLTVSTLPEGPASDVRGGLVIIALLACVLTGVAGFLAVLPPSIAAGINRRNLRNAALVAGGTYVGATLLGFLF